MSDPDLTCLRCGAVARNKGLFDFHYRNCGKVTPAVYREMELAIEKALRDEREAGRICDDCRTVLPDGSGYCERCDDFTMPSDFSLRWVRRSEMDKTIAAEREACAVIAETLYAHRIFDVDSILRAEIATAIRERD
jgi:hypothetical protein